VCCSRTHVSPQIADEIRHLVALPLGWDLVFSAAAEHGIAALLFRHICAIGPDANLSAHLDRLKTYAHAASIHALVLSAELIRILDALAAAGIQAIPYKGPVLAVQAYGDLALRDFADIDLVVRQRDVSAANDMLARLGFSPQFPPIFAPDEKSPLIPGEYDYLDRERQLIVELHTEQTLRHFPSPPDLEEICSRLETVSLSGHPIHTFSPEDTFVFLCVHGSKDCWERIVWVADVAEFVASHSRLDWDRLYAFADSVRARRIVHLGLALADHLIGISLPGTIRSRADADRVAVSTAAQIRQRLLGRAPAPLGARATFTYRRHMVPGVVAGLRYAMRLATAPAADDWHSVRLPRPLAPLYSALRPFRLLRKYGSPQVSPARPPS
jgi:hypothetical protein